MRKPLPYVISFAVGLAIPDEASARLIQVLAAFRALQAGCMPLQVRGDSQDVLVMDLTSTADTHSDSGLLCRMYINVRHSTCMPGSPDTAIDTPVHLEQYVTHSF